MRGVAAALLLASLLAGCGGRAPVPLDDLLVRPADMPAGWRLLDFTNDAVSGDAAYPMATNPQAFTHAELVTLGWGGTLEARAIAFVREDAPSERLIMFWAGRLEDDETLRGIVADACLAADDVQPSSGRNVVFAAAYAIDDLAVVQDALRQVVARTHAANACPDEVRRQVGEPPSASPGAVTRLLLGEQERASFAYELQGPVRFVSNGALTGVLLDADLHRWPGTAGAAWDVEVPPGRYVLRVTSMAPSDPSRTQEFVLEAEQVPPAGHGEG